MSPTPGLSALDPRSASLAERTIVTLRKAVLAGVLVPGRLYSVYQVAEDLGISRSPVREALLRLAETGMVRFERNRGFRVVPPAPRDIAEIFSIRLALEVPAVRRATLHASAVERVALRRRYEAMEAAASSGDEPAFEEHDQELHALLIDIDGNARAGRIVANLRDATRLAGASTVESDRSLREVLIDHLPIVEAFEAADAEAAASAMERHLETTGRLLLRRALHRHGSSEDESSIWDRLAGRP